MGGLRLEKRRVGDCRVECLQWLSNETIHGLPALLGRPPVKVREALGGRTCPVTADLPGVGRVVIKHFRRGGLMEQLAGDRYFRWGKTRARREFDMLITAGNCGLTVPSPLACIERGSCFYQCWLVLKEIPEARTLASLSTTDADRAIALMPDLVRQIEILVKHRLVHVDLHPGNVLVDANDKVWIIDFDKGYQRAQPEARLVRHYRNRWNRAVAKHHLPAFLTDSLLL